MPDRKPIPPPQRTPAPRHDGRLLVTRVKQAVQDFLHPARGDIEPRLPRTGKKR